ncbi:hypothetical protein CC80DRAFT_493106 [Byssothecium circinans]|uniref:Uncharacterized protein n=1 Tax=Byssothecium circinans TaxID=147558 RepID=A0A6A5TU12_9PLEO|nr:hypothetical protein CC80DRAFT_493106 [Byssothecium circinans]
MAAMFGDYSFEAASRHPICDDRHKGDDVESPASVRPFTAPARLPTPPPDMGDLVDALDQQSLRITVDTSFQSTSHHEPLTPLGDERSPTNSTSRLHSATLRMQRQANVRMQCEMSHVKDITKLVEMIEAGDQCNVCERKSASDDEGIDMHYTPTIKKQLHTVIPLYRSNEHDTGARVSKRPRMRRRRASKSSSK